MSVILNTANVRSWKLYPSSGKGRPLFKVTQLVHDKAGQKPSCGLLTVSLFQKLVLLGHLATGRRLGEALESFYKFMQEEEPPPSGCSTEGVERDTRLQKNPLPRAAALFLASNPSINGAWWSQRLLAA